MSIHHNGFIPHHPKYFWPDCQWIIRFHTANVNVKIILIPINSGIFARLSNLGYCSNMAEQNRTRREGSMPIYR